ncbi:MAG: hypothetical protein Unbinned5081contig1000_41 [Prokaryotic dsDNA virus sp.]|nr:MAG: hypothetical protein Unbinned5081contig1000_41 [Prokaryotic dsDNA virus sp.]
MANEIADSINELLFSVALGNKVDVTEEDAAILGAKVSMAIERALTGRGKAQPRDGKKIYFSEVGSPCWRKVYYKYYGVEGETLMPHALLKFIYGDLLEELLLFLAEKAGNKVENQQGEVEIPLRDGWVLRGRIDAEINGKIVDVKSASTFAMKKFESLESLRKDDAFGYEDQLTGYAAGLNRVGDNAEFLAVDKTLGHIKSMSVPVTQGTVDALKNKADQMTRMLEQPSPPAKMLGFEQPEGKSGNKKLCVTCSYCPYKNHCHKDSNGGRGLRTFLYSKGPVFLTEVQREPKATEI